MKYEEATNKSLTVRWKTSCCISGDECWCRIIEPEDEIIDEQGFKVTIADAGSISREYAEYIVRLHNNYIDERK